MPRHLLTEDTVSTTTTFNTDGSISETMASGMTRTTVFNADGTITETWGAPYAKVVTTTFNTDGSITQSIV
jgi:diaminopimelate epimerase